MKIGVVGLGKVGLVLAQVLRHIGKHEVIGYDVRSADDIYDDLDTQREPAPQGALTIADDVRTVVLASDVVYICVPTPSKVDEGVDDDFDYTYLADALGAVSQEASKQQKRITAVVLSTVAPGTFMEQLIRSEDEYISLVYSPSFISLGTVWEDMVSPEAILIGADSPADANLVSRIWEPITDASRIRTSIESAEIIKMASNTLQYMKIQYVNVLAQLAEKTGGNIDDVTKGLRRILNHGWIPRAGMPDGGPCRPRDVKAMSAASYRYMGYGRNFFDELVELRETQFDHIANQILSLSEKFPDLPILILGDTYKAGVNYTDEAPGAILFRRLHNRGLQKRTSLVPGNFTKDSKLLDKALYIIAVPFELDPRNFPEGSVVYDVWGMGEDDPNYEVTFITPGRPYGF